jgi:hypothetical protein
LGSLLGEILFGRDCIAQDSSRCQYPGTDLRRTLPRYVPVFRVGDWKDGAYHALMNAGLYTGSL